MTADGNGSSRSTQESANLSGSGDELSVAVVGGGIVGVVMALGLIKRGVHVKIYEQARNFREIGAGVAFTKTAQKCMELLDTRILEAMKKVGNANVTEWSQYVDGYNQAGDGPDDTYETPLFKTPIADMGFWGCHRAHFLDELTKMLPEDAVYFRKRLLRYVDEEGSDKVRLEFEDGSFAEADAVIGCDGLKSKVRQVMFGVENPVSQPHYSHKIAYRAVVSMDAAINVIGQEKAYNQCMHMGPNAHLLIYPLARYTLMNIIAFVTYQGEWPDAERLQTPATKKDVMEAFKDWNAAVRGIMNLVPDELEQWAIFDMYDHPADRYAVGRTVLAGDAAHAACPHHGAGAGFGVEDALAMASVFEEIVKDVKIGCRSKAQALKDGFQSYNSVRYERTQWLVKSSRETGDIYEWAYPQSGSDPEKCKEEMIRRTRIIWNYDIGAMIRNVKQEYLSLA